MSKGMAEAEKAALARHKELIGLRSLGIRYVDHYPAERIATPRLLEGAEANLFEAEEELESGTGRQDSAFRQLWARVISPHADRNAAISGMWSRTEEADSYLKRLAGLREKYLKRGRRGAGELRKAILDDGHLRAIAENLPEGPEEYARLLGRGIRLQRYIPGPPRREFTDEGMTRHRAMALAGAAYAPTLAVALKKVFEDPRFGRREAEYDGMMRAAAYFRMPRPEGIAYGSRGEVRQLFWNERVYEYLDMALKGLVSSSRPSPGWPYAYNSLLLVHPSSYRAFPAQYNQAWGEISTRGGDPRMGLVVIEPSVHAARETAKRLAAIWKRDPGHAIPIYDYTGRLVWPPARGLPKMRHGWEWLRGHRGGR
ncbi:MAG: hypothetical protein V1787_01995 [Candidatus Micrarchaeota archaeon]